MRPSRETIGQEQLFAINPLTGTEVRFADNESVKAVEKNIYLIDTLDLFAVANSAFGLEKASHIPAVEDELATRYGDAAQHVVQGSSQKTGPNALKMAKYRFARATSMFERIEKNPDAEDDIKAATKAEYEEFEAQYFGANNAEARKTLRARLLSEISEASVAISSMDREKTIRPHDTALGLPSPDRLRAILEDPRARFIPMHNAEKNIVLAWLDYLDNPDYPLGVTNQLIDVANHQSKLFGHSKDPNKSPDRAKESIIYEVADSLENATEQSLLLRDLLTGLYEPLYPELKLEGTEFSEHAAIGAMCRYFDAYAYMTGDTHRAVNPSSRNGQPLTTRTDRFKDSGPGRHKIIHDRYTRNATEKVTLQAQEFASGLTIVQARQLAAAAYINEVARGTFFEARLTEIAINPGKHQQIPRIIAIRELRRINRDQDTPKVA